MHKPDANELVEYIFPILVIVMVVSLILWKAAYGANTPTAPYGCAWIDCRPNEKGKMNCNGPIYGTHRDLLKSIQENDQGAISYDCGPGKGKKNESKSW